ncbi:MAG: aquaporin family protein [Chloroflexi bacterium]|nr:aquaporin family protein [Chloroflexota bacterium]
MADFRRQCVAEFVGTALLVATVVGSGIAAQRLSPNDTGLELLENALATGAGLVAIILAVGPVSGAHLNPVVSAADAAFGGLPWRSVPGYVAAQVLGAIGGAVLANLMFGGAAISWATHVRSGGGLWLAEVVATIGLLLTIFGVVRSGRAKVAPFAVGAYITAAYWFTSSTSFANPAVTIGRMFSDSFAGIAPASAPGFVASQVVGGALAVWLIRYLLPDVSDESGDVVVPHEVKLQP